MDIDKLDSREMHDCRDCSTCKFHVQYTIFRKRMNNTVLPITTFFCFCDYPEFNDFDEEKGLFTPEDVAQAEKEFLTCSAQLFLANRRNTEIDSQPFSEGTACIMMVDNYDDLEKSPRLIDELDTSGCCQYHKYFTEK